MKKILCFFLAFCLLIPLAVTPAFASVGSVEEFEQLKQKAEAGDAAAMAEVANVYLVGSYNNGISRDFAQALSWLLRAADAGNTDVYLPIARLYETGSAGERSTEKAYEWYKRASELGSSEAEELITAPSFAEYRWKDNTSLLTGTLGEYGNLGGRFGTPFYLDAPVLNCSTINMQLRFIQWRGWPFGTYGLFAQDLNGDWVELQRFQIEKYQGEEGAEPRTYEFQFSAPVSFRALGVVLLEDGMDFDLVHEDLFYVDKACVGAYSDIVSKPSFTPSGAQYPENSSSFGYSSYTAPDFGQ